MADGKGLLFFAWIDLDRLKGGHFRTYILDFLLYVILQYIKFIYSEKATKFCEITTIDLIIITYDKSTVEISQKFVALSEYMNFTYVI